MSNEHVLSGFDAWMEPVKGASAFLGLLTGIAGTFYTNDAEVAVVCMCMTSICALVLFKAVAQPSG